MPNPDVISDIDIDSIKGFLHPDEGRRLHTLALEQSPQGACLEIGSYCGKSAVYLGRACQQVGGTLFTVDHHRGSEEHQVGEGYHDPELFDASRQLVDSLPALRDTLRAAKLEDTVVPIVAASPVVSRHWSTPLALLFIDGGHSMEAAQADYDGWAKTVMAGGVLAIHDVFPDPADGGRPPFEIYQQALASGDWEDEGMTRSLAVLRRRDSTLSNDSK